MSLRELLGLKGRYQKPPEKSWSPLTLVAPRGLLLRISTQPTDTQLQWFAESIPTFSSSIRRLAALSVIQCCGLGLARR